LQGSLNGLLYKTDSDPAQALEIFTNGFCWPNPGGVIGVAAAVNGVAVFGKGIPPDPHNSNSRAEIGAIIFGLRQVPEPSKITVFTDSEYAARGYQTWLNGEHGDRENADVFALIEVMAAPHDFALKFVPRDSNKLIQLANKAAVIVARRALQEFGASSRWFQ
jgi:ribonuclease HI